VSGIEGFYKPIDYESFIKINRVSITIFIMAGTYLRMNCMSVISFEYKIYSWCFLVLFFFVLVNVKSSGYVFRLFFKSWFYGYSIVVLLQGSYADGVMFYSKLPTCNANILKLASEKTANS
jgi:hypothetical protein